MKYLILLMSCLLVAILFNDSYTIIYCQTIFILIFFIINNKVLSNKIILIYLLIYYSISLIPGSTYRGEVSVYTLKLYSIMCCSPCLITLINKPFKKSRFYQQVNTSKTFYKIYWYHIAIVYLSLFIIIIQNGLVIVDQENRFGIDNSLSYIVKSSIYFPLIYFIAEKNKKTKYSIWKFYVVPLFPALFIGSRGTVIMMLFSIIIVRILITSNIKNKVQAYIQKLKSRRILVFSAILSFTIIVGFSYVRRLNSTILVSTDAIVYEYFHTNSIFAYVFAPFHFALREQIGITNYIIERKLSGGLPYPMFIADLVTILPGKQPAAGITLNLAMTNNDHAGLTPGLLGALYMDVGNLAILSILIASILLFWLYKKSLKSEIWLIVYGLSIVQFFHIFHRGFLKPEYFFAYIIIYLYIFFLKKRTI